MVVLRPTTNWLTFVQILKKCEAVSTECAATLTEITSQAEAVIAKSVSNWFTFELQKCGDITDVTENTITKDLNSLELNDTKEATVYFESLDECLVRSPYFMPLLQDTYTKCIGKTPNNAKDMKLLNFVISLLHYACRCDQKYAYIVSKSSNSEMQIPPKCEVVIRDCTGNWNGTNKWAKTLALKFVMKWPNFQQIVKKCEASSTDCAGALNVATVQAGTVMHHIGWSSILFDQRLPLHGIESNDVNILRMSKVTITEASERLVKKWVIEIEKLENSVLCVVPRPVKLRIGTNWQDFAHEIDLDDNGESVKGDLLVSAMSTSRQGRDQGMQNYSRTPKPL